MNIYEPFVWEIKMQRFSKAIRVPRAEHVAGELQRMNLVEAKLRQAVALKNDVIDGLKDRETWGISTDKNIWKQFENSL